MFTRYFLRAMVVAWWALFAQGTAHAASGDKKQQSADQAKVLERRARLGAARSWGYQLRIRNLEPLAASTADVLVIDHGYAAKHRGKTMFDVAEVEALKTKADGRRRLVLAYLSIGEAEQYRFYWQAAWCQRANAPGWMGAVNPNWPGNYPVRFWDPGWQRLILDPVEGYLAKIQAQGFDGIYLDRTDVYGEWGQENGHAEADMIRFLTAIADAARAKDPRFLVVMQNAEELLRHARVRNILDGMAKEDLLYGLKFTEAPNSAADVRSAVEDLQRAKADKIPVFAVEYLADRAKIAAARKRLLGLGFVPTFAPRLLGSLPKELLPPETKVAEGSAEDAPQLAAPSASSAGWGEGGPTCLLD